MDWVNSANQTRELEPTWAMGTVNGVIIWVTKGENNPYMGQHYNILAPWISSLNTASIQYLYGSRKHYYYRVPHEDLATIGNWWSMYCGFGSTNSKNLSSPSQLLDLIQSLFWWGNLATEAMTYREQELGIQINLDYPGRGSKLLLVGPSMKITNFAASNPICETLLIRRNYFVIDKALEVNSKPFFSTLFCSTRHILIFQILWSWKRLVLFPPQLEIRSFQIEYLLFVRKSAKMLARVCEVLCLNSDLPAFISMPMITKTESGFSKRNPQFQSKIEIVSAPSITACSSLEVYIFSTTYFQIRLCHQHTC